MPPSTALRTADRRAALTNTPGCTKCPGAGAGVDVGAPPITQGGLCCAQLLASVSIWAEQHAAEPPGSLPQPAPAHVPQLAAQHADPRERTPVLHDGSAARAEPTKRKSMAAAPQTMLYFNPAADSRTEK